MKIKRVDAIPLRIPFDYGGRRTGWAGSSWSALDMLLVRVETADGIVGWGEAFSYNCLGVVKAAVEDMVAPLVIGRQTELIEPLMVELQKALHLYGRYGITLFALSGLDIALWDIAGKRAGRPLAELFGGPVHKALPAYASLLRYGSAPAVAERTEAAIAEGYRFVKVHEITDEPVKAAHEALGAGARLMVDTNCPWGRAEAEAVARRWNEYDLLWLEEPLFPPEDFLGLAEIRERTGVPIAAGENACTSWQFAEMFLAQAVTYAQPSVTKVGGITEFLKVATLADAHGVALAPHSPYFGPGFLATLQLAASRSEICRIERFYLKPEASLYGNLIDPLEGAFAVPSGPGLGCEPDPDVIRAFQVKQSMIS